MYKIKNLEGKVIFEGTDLSRADLSRADLSRANLFRADLLGADLSGADLSGANLFRANLVEANLSGANLSRANLLGADLLGADLFRANLVEANLSRANLTGANLTGANLYRADLSRADLSRADLSRANLSGANLYGADLLRANLYRAYLSGADLSGAKGLVKIVGVEVGNYYWKRFNDNLCNNGYQFKVGLNKLRKGEKFADDERIMCSYPGFHFASRSWCATHYSDRPLEAKIRIPEGAKINEPWATDGKASADMIEILQVFDTKTGEDVTNLFKIG